MSVEVDTMTMPHTPHKVIHAERPTGDPAHAPGKQHLDIDHIRTDRRRDPMQFQRNLQATRVQSHALRTQRGT